MKRVRMIITNTTVHSIDRVLSSYEIETIRQAIKDGENVGNLVADYTSEENIVDGGYELNEFEVIEE